MTEDGVRMQSTEVRAICRAAKAAGREAPHHSIALQALCSPEHPLAAVAERK